MFDEQQAMQMALDISGNHVVCLDLKDNRVYDLFGKAVFGEEMGIEAYYAGFHPDDTAGTPTLEARAPRYGATSTGTPSPSLRTASP